MAELLDVGGYVDLTLYDADTQELVDRALADAVAKLPGWVPREGNLEVVLLESYALLAAETVFAANRVPAGVLEVLLRLYGLDRDPGQPPTATVRFHLSDTAGHTVPAGTTVRLERDGEDLELTTDTSLVVAAGAATGVVAATGTVPTSSLNGIAAGTDLEVVDAVVYVDSAELETAVTGGTDPETSAAFLDRGVQRLARLVETLVLPVHFTARALEETDVVRATTVDLYDPGQVGNPGDHAGHVTVAVAGSDGTALSAARMTELDLAFTEQAQANLLVHVVAPTVTAVDVTVTVVRHRGYDAAAVTANVQAALAAYLDPDAWPWAATVRRFELVALIDGAEGVDYVADLAAPAADVALPGVAPLAKLGAVAVTVNAP